MGEATKKQLNRYERRFSNFTDNEDDFRENYDRASERRDVFVEIDRGFNKWEKESDG